MTSKEKAEELFWKFRRVEIYDDQAQECAIIAVDEILELDVTWFDKQLVDKYSKTYTPDQCREYWLEVKQYLEEML